MSREAGLPKTGGRKKGTPNKRTLGLEEALKSNGLDVIEEISKLLPQLSEDRRAELLTDLMTYIYPKRKAVETTVQSEVTVTASPQTGKIERLSKQEIEEKIWQMTKAHLECDAEFCNKVLDLIEDMKSRLLIRVGPDGKYRS